MKPLQGLKVIDFSKVLAGPLCAQHLGDLGAEIIKVEPLKFGDDTRRWPPFRGNDGTVFLSANRNKQSLALDLKTLEGKEIAHQLVGQADVLIESFSPGVQKRLGLNHELIRKINPRLIYCSISGFGTCGPLRDAKGYDVILQAFAGIMSVTGDEGGVPVRSPFSPVDQATGFHATTGILAALLQRATTQTGALVEVSLFDSAISFLAYFLQGYWETGKQPMKSGSGHESLCPYQAFQTADDYILLGIANDSLWKKFCDLTDLSRIADDPRFCTNDARVKNRAATVGMVQSVLINRNCEEWTSLFGKAGIPCSPIQSLSQVMEHPHTKSSGMVIEYEHGTYGPLKTIAQPIRFDGHRNQPFSPPPLLGEHSIEILKSSGFSESIIKGFLERQIVYSPKSDSVFKS